MLKFLYLLFVTASLTACMSTPVLCPTPEKGDRVYVVGEGWHAEIGIPVEELDQNLSFYRETYSGAKVLMFGYGKQTFITAPPDTFSEYCLGPIPGPAVIQVVGLYVTPLKAYPAENVRLLRLPPHGAQMLATYIWNDLTKDDEGHPIVVAQSENPVGLFYKAESEYNLIHTCNTWTADALNAAGLPISSDDVIFSGQVMTRVTEAEKAQCQ